MHFDSWQAFWAMGGYGLYVWLSFGLSYLLLAGITGYSVYQQRQLKQQLAAKLARQQRLQQYQEQRN